MKDFNSQGSHDIGSEKHRIEPRPTSTASSSSRRSSSSSGGSGLAQSSSQQSQSLLLQERPASNSTGVSKRMLAKTMKSRDIRSAGKRKQQYRIADLRKHVSELEDQVRVMTGIIQQQQHEIQLLEKRDATADHASPVPFAPTQFFLLFDSAEQGCQTEITCLNDWPNRFFILDEYGHASPVLDSAGLSHGGAHPDQQLGTTAEQGDLAAGPEHPNVAHVISSSAATCVPAERDRKYTSELISSDAENLVSAATPDALSFDEGRASTDHASPELDAIFGAVGKEDHASPAPFEGHASPVQDAIAEKFQDFTSQSSAMPVCGHLPQPATDAAPAIFDVAETPEDHAPADHASLVLDAINGGLAKESTASPALFDAQCTKGKKKAKKKKNKEKEKVDHASATQDESNDISFNAAISACDKGGVLHGTSSISRDAQYEHHSLCDQLHCDHLGVACENGSEALDDERPGVPVSLECDQLQRGNLSSEKGVQRFEADAQEGGPPLPERDQLQCGFQTSAKGLHAHEATARDANGVGVRIAVPNVISPSSAISAESHNTPQSPPEVNSFISAIFWFNENGDHRQSGPFENEISFSSVISRFGCEKDGQIARLLECLHELTQQRHFTIAGASAILRIVRHLPPKIAPVHAKEFAHNMGSLLEKHQFYFKVYDSHGELQENIAQILVICLAAFKE